jgi:hypothetical protein
MTRTHRTRTALAALAALAVSITGVTGIASASGASTKVTIKEQSDGFYGYVKSSDPQLCADGRKVTLFKQTGGVQNPRNDLKIGSDIAQANGNKYMWSTGNTGSTQGKFYARAGKKPGCQAATSKTV